MEEEDEEEDRKVVGVDATKGLDVLLKTLPDPEVAAMYSLRR